MIIIIIIIIVIIFIKLMTHSLTVEYIIMRAREAKTHLHDRKKTG